MKRFFEFLLPLTLLILGIPNPANSNDAVVQILLFVYVGLVVVGAGKLIHKYFLQRLIIIPVLILFVISSQINSLGLRDFLAHQPISETYRTDMDDFLKTYYLMGEGLPYYISFKQAVEENAFKSKVSNNLWSWRLPTVFYIWKWLPGESGVGIYYLFLFLSLGGLYLSYALIGELLSKKNQHFAILSAYLLFPYFHFALRDPTLLQTEWWGVFPLLGGIYFLVKNRLNGAIVLFILTVIIRELFMIPLIGIGVLLYIKKSREAWKMLLPMGIFFLMMFFHGQQVLRITGANGEFFAPRIHTLGSKIVLSTLAFGSWEYAWNQLRIFPIFYVISLVGIIFTKSWFSKYLLVFFVFPVSFLILGSSVYNDYWGIFYMPFVIISTPLILNYL